MRLSELASTNHDVAIAGITADSRQVKKGWLFAALPGSKADGRSFIDDAVTNGAAAVLAGPGAALKDGGAILITDDNPRRAFAQIAAKFYGRQPGTIAAVTGTSGKTSTVTFTQQLWALAGEAKAASLGTLGVRAPGMETYGRLTTPDTASLHAQLADLAAAGVTHLAMEASSHGLDQYRLDGVKIRCAAYTNLSRDHLDYHPDMDAYFAAKARLFTELLPEGGTAVINADDDYGRQLIALCQQSGRKVMRIGSGQDYEIALTGRVPQPEGQEIHVRVLGEEFEVSLPLVGDFQVMNALTALGLLLAEGRKARDVVSLLEKLQGVPGRLELVAGHPKGAAVYVDYAHKPGALETVLKTLRPHTQGRLFCVVGCGGDRDAGKRPIMGKISSELADVTVVTDDNPRSEDPAKIRQAVMSGAPGAKEIGDRREAIGWAVAQLQAGDVLVVAGKGHEQGQTVGDTVLPFDDVTEVKNAMERVKV